MYTNMFVCEDMIARQTAIHIQGKSTIQGDPL